MTIFDVASKAGVTKSTVSRVFNNSYRGNPEVAETIRKIGAELGYNGSKSNSRGRPRLNTTRCIRIESIALLIPDSSEVAMRTALCGCLAQGVSRALTQNKINMIFTNLTPSGDMPMCVEKKQVDGIIVRATAGLNTLEKKFNSIPFVVAFENFQFTQSMKADFVQPDNRVVAELAIDYLRSQGCRSMLALASNPKHHAVVERICEFTSFAEKLGINFTKRMEARPIEETIKTVFDGNDRPDGIFMPVGDLAATDACRALERIGIRPVDDVKLITCNNSPEYLWAVDDRIPNINIRADMVGQMAAECLLERIKSPDAEFRRILVRPQLEFKPK